MAWLATYDDTNKIIDEVTARPDTLILSAGLAYSVMQRTITQTKYRYTSMTAAAAQAGAIALQAACPSGTTRTAVAKRQNDADAWYIEVFDIVYGAFVTTAHS